jgi:hypothetical protein
MRAVLGCREARAATVGLRQALFAEACGTKIQEGQGVGQTAFVAQPEEH